MVRTGLRAVGVIAASLVLGACITVGPDYESPEVVVADGLLDGRHLLGDELVVRLVVV